MSEDLLSTLQHFKNQGTISKVRMNSVNDQYVCESCKALQNEEISLDYALEHLPIPNQCTNEKCRCYYTPIVDVDLFRKSLRDSLGG